MSTLLKWAQNTQGKLNNKNSTTNGERKWIHPPEALQKGHIAYLVKFLGNTVVDQPKGIEVVKEGIRKLQFSQQLKKSETGTAKTRKVELTVSIDGVAIQEPKTHTILHQFPLHRISYCADDKGEKKFFSFIAKQPNQENEQEDKHECFVFISDKLAEEITLTIGQAFELAYKRFLDTSGKDLDSQKRMVLTQQRIKRLEQENNIYKQRLLDVSKFASIRNELDQYLRKNDIKSLLEVPASNAVLQNGTSDTSNHQDYHLLDLEAEITNGNAPPVPPRNIDNAPTVGTMLQNLLLDDLEDNDDDFDPRSFETKDSNTNGTQNGPTPLLAPPPKAAKRSINNNNNETAGRTFGQDLFSVPNMNNNNNIIKKGGQTPNSAKILDPFEMGDFNSAQNPASKQEFENAIGFLDKKLVEMQTGFSRGISFGNEDFSLESFDPLKN